MQWKWNACCCELVGYNQKHEARTYVADTPGDSALLARSGSLVSLALDAEVHDVVTADGAVVDDDVPGPESYRVPLCGVSHDLHILVPVV
jgi:hypothetical protein